MIPKIDRTSTPPRFLTDGGEEILLAGEVHNSSSSSPEAMQAIWPLLCEMHMNCAIVSASWELIEPRRGEYDFESVDHLIRSAREKDLHLILIWFGTWKNGMSTYVPEWVKRDTKRYFRCRDRSGAAGRTISPFCRECVEEDAAAFAALMRHLWEIDEREQTVWAVQVENEVGFLGGNLDCSDAAQAAWTQEPPQPLLDALGVRGHTWREAFGARAEEAFQSYSFARAVQRVAEAGKAEYPLPMFVNAWTEQYPGEYAGLRPSGGPVSRARDIWRAAAPALDAFAPDLYQLNFASECAEYGASGKRPLLIPEMRADRFAPAMILYAIGQGALLVSPFGAEDLPQKGQAEPIGRIYAEIRGMLPLLLRARSSGEMRSVLQGDLRSGGMQFGRLHLRVNYDFPPDEGHSPGALLVIREEEEAFLLFGFGLTAEFYDEESAKVDFISITEGSFAGGQWRAGRRLNGDELHLHLGREPKVLRVRIYRYS